MAGRIYRRDGMFSIWIRVAVRGDTAEGRGQTVSRMSDFPQIVGDPPLSVHFIAQGFGDLNLVTPSWRARTSLLPPSSSSLHRSSLTLHKRKPQLTPPTTQSSPHRLTGQCSPFWISSPKTSFIIRFNPGYSPSRCIPTRRLRG